VPRLEANAKSLALRTTGSLSAPPYARLDHKLAGVGFPASLAPSSAPLGFGEVSIYREGIGWIRGTKRVLAALETPLAGAPRSVKLAAACREAIMPAAVARGATEIYVGATRHMSNRRVALLEVRIFYKGVSGYEVRQATVTCELDRSGQVLAVADATATGP
jgi:hypothetical protein